MHCCPGEGRPNACSATTLGQPVSQSRMLRSSAPAALPTAPLPPAAPSTSPLDSRASLCPRSHIYGDDGALCGCDALFRGAPEWAQVLGVHAGATPTGGSLAGDRQCPSNTVLVSAGMHAGPRWQAPCRWRAVTQCNHPVRAAVLPRSQSVVAMRAFDRCSSPSPAERPVSRDRDWRRHHVLSTARTVPAASYRIAWAIETHKTWHAGSDSSSGEFASPLCCEHLSLVPKAKLECERL